MTYHVSEPTAIELCAGVPPAYFPGAGKLRQTKFMKNLVMEELSC
jgi:hypothetical protein